MASLLIRPSLLQNDWQLSTKPVRFNLFELFAEDHLVSQRLSDDMQLNIPLVVKIDKVQKKGLGLTCFCLCTHQLTINFNQLWLVKFCVTAVNMNYSATNVTVLVFASSFTFDCTGPALAIRTTSHYCCCGCLFHISDDGTGNNQSWLLCSCVAEWGESVRKWERVGGTPWAWVWRYRQSPSHPDLLIAQEL